MQLIPSDRCPALQYLDDVEKGGVAEKAGLLPRDFVLAVSCIILYLNKRKN
jgi:SH3/ankyrin repeat-containing protein